MAKEKADRRREADRRLTEPVPYVKGCPTRMLFDSEADLLAEVRSEASAMLGFRARYRDRALIHARYAELLDMHTNRGEGSMTDAAPSHRLLILSCLMTKRGGPQYICRCVTDMMGRSGAHCVTSIPTSRRRGLPFCRSSTVFVTPGPRSKITTGG